MLIAKMMLSFAERDDIMKKALVVVDMQNDFVDGVLGTAEAVAIIPAIKEKIAVSRNNNCDIVFTRDTHCDNYLETQEGRKLPVKHCIKDTQGWQICPELRNVMSESDIVVDKPVFGSVKLGELLSGYDEVELCGVCTDICVIANAAVIRAFSPETEISVDSACVAGVTKHSNNVALEAMRALQISIK